MIHSVFTPLKQAMAENEIGVTVASLEFWLMGMNKIITNQ